VKSALDAAIALRGSAPTRYAETRHAIGRSPFDERGVDGP
jgi:hypothetical protein